MCISHPTCLILGEEPGSATTLIDVGFHVVAGSHRSVCDWPDAELVVASGDASDALLPAVIRRERERPLIPVVAVASAAWIAITDWRALGYDGALARNAPLAVVSAALAEWQRADTLATVARLRAQFGVAEMSALLHGFRDLLTRVRDEPDVDATVALAHRVAGISGTLGFAPLGRLWLRLADGEVELAGSARRAAAYAIITLDRCG